MDEKSRNASVKRSVAVIGAGMAGISAARRLLDEGNDFEVIILEANPERYGGRIYSFDVPGVTGKPVDLGAMWIHAGTNPQQPIAELCHRFGIKTIPHDVLHPAYMSSFDESGHPHSHSQASIAMCRLKQLFDMKKERIQTAMSLDASYRALYHELEQDSPDFMNQDVVKYMAQTTIESYNGALADDLSAKFMDGVPEYEENAVIEGSDTIIPTGYRTLLDKIISNGRNVSIILDRRAERVIIDERNGNVKIVCSDSNNQRYRYEADHVIVAVPLGVLKARSIHFDPALSPKMVNAIDRIGFGNQVKVLLVFDGEPFWPDFEALLMETKETVGWCTVFVNMRKINGLNALVAMLSSYAANLADSMDDEGVIQRVLERLAAVIGEDNINRHRLSYAKVTRWRNDPLFRGTYSYGKMGMEAEDAFAIRQPVLPYIFFAGEHTLFPEGEYGTVYAAYISGQRAAEDVVKAKHSNPTKNQQGSRKERSNCDDKNNATRSRL